MPQIHTTYFRKLPSVDEVLRSPEAQLWVAQSSRAVVAEAVRAGPDDGPPGHPASHRRGSARDAAAAAAAILRQVQAQLQAQQTTICDA